jgi:hypothetical protein
MARISVFRGLDAHTMIDKLEHGFDYFIVQRAGKHHEAVLMLSDFFSCLIHGERFEFRRGDEWNGASVPYVLRWVTGSPTNHRFALASLVHDRLYDIMYDRAEADAIFHQLLRSAGVGKVHARTMWLGVRSTGWVFYRARTTGGKFWKWANRKLYTLKA